MGKKDAGRALKNMPIDQYMIAMGGSVDQNVKNTGVAFTNNEVFKYYRLLREYALNRIRWTSPTIPEYELRLIEWNIFHYGKCAMLKPKITKNGVSITTDEPRIYECAYTEVNERNGRPLKISIVNNTSSRLTIDVNYDCTEFVIFTDEYLFAASPTPMRHIAWEYACKLHELDLAFNANSHRQRMPFVFNNGSTTVEDANTFNITTNKGMSIAEIMRSAYGRNEQFVEIPQSMVGANGFMHEPQYVNNEINNLIEAQKRLYESYLEIIGLYTNRERSGVYTIKDLQKEGDETGDFRTECLKNTRLICAREAAEMFHIDLVMEVI